MPDYRPPFYPQSLPQYRKEGDACPPFTFDHDLEEVESVGYKARYPNGCIVRGDLRTIDAERGVVEAVPLAHFPAGTVVHLEIRWNNGCVETPMTDIKIVAK